MKKVIVLIMVLLGVGIVLNKSDKDVTNDGELFV